MLAWINRNLSYEGRWFRRNLIQSYPGVCGLLEDDNLFLCSSLISFLPYCNELFSLIRHSVKSINLNFVSGYVQALLLQGRQKGG